MTKQHFEVSLKGKEGSVVTVLADSISSIGQHRITTFEIELPRLIWGECLTHRLFSRNAASSRAIPIRKKIKQVWNNPAMFVHWGRNQSGMQAETELKGWRRSLTKFVWLLGSKLACTVAYVFNLLDVHKQIANRVLEPFEMHKVVLTSTELENWFWLRYHKDAQPEIAEIAELTYEARRMSQPMVLNPGEWHLPYIRLERDEQGFLHYYTLDGVEVDLETAKRISVSCCAQVSYRVLNTTSDKAEDIYQKLIGSKPVHASPCEHQATPMMTPSPARIGDHLEPGITHYNFELETYWSGNFQGWIQNRQLIPENVKMT